MPSHSWTKLASSISRRHLDIIRRTCQLLYTDIYFLAYLLQPSGGLADCATLLLCRLILFPSPPLISEGLGEIGENIIVSHSLWSRNSNYRARMKTIRTWNWAHELYLNRTLRERPVTNCIIHASLSEEVELLNIITFTRLFRHRGHLH